MARRKITPELWRQVTEAYNAWNPNAPGAGKIDLLLAPYGISKQAFYAEARRTGLPLKSSNRPATVAGPGQDETVMALVEMLVECKMRVAELQLALSEANQALMSTTP